MRGSRTFLLMTLGLAGFGFSAAACGEAFTSSCEGAECRDDLDGGLGGDALGDSGDGSNPDASRDAEGDVGETGPACDGEASPAADPCVIDEVYGVFVAPNGNDDSGDGSRTSPYATLDRGLARAKALSKRLYVCDDGTGYAESVTVNDSLDGLAVYGGFACSDWSYGESKAKVRPSAPGVVWRFDSLLKGFLLEDFALEAPDAELPGESSVAVIVNASAGVTLRRVEIGAGKGQEGESATAILTAADGGQDGQAGNTACHANPNPGAASKETLCGAVVTSGGKGGDGAIGLNSAGNGNAGLPLSSSGDGEEGIGQGSKPCTSGTPGKDGDKGGPGSGGTGFGSLDESGWRGASGAEGKTGSPGQGGGGGGGAKAPLTCLLSTPTGASGGSGGGGGCGGSGGPGGMAGGASIAVVSIDSELLLEDCELRAANGGTGGAGASGQAGGTGGSGAPGGAGTGGSSTACNGGNGGRGGNGGPGGGGAGGHSLGIAYKGDAPTRIGGSITLGQAGSGGEPGLGSDASGKGASGVEAEERAF